MTFPFPELTPAFDASSDHFSHLLYCNAIRNVLRRILPEDIFYAEEFSSALPIVKWLEWGMLPHKNLSLFLLCHHRPNASKFFYEIVSHWLIPGKRANVCLFFSTDFRVCHRDREIYSIAEIVVSLEDSIDLEIIRHHLPIIESEIRLGVASIYHANRIMEIKGLSSDVKTALIQERIAFLLQRRPKDFDYDIFSQMQHFLIMCREEFKSVREYYHMSRIISVFYLFRKGLRQHVEAFPLKRHLSLKLLKTRLHLPLGVKKVLSIFVGLNFLKENEIFEQRHLTKALQNYIPHLKVVEDSFFIDENREDNIQIIYLEVEKENAEDFSSEEMRKLRKGLPEDVKSRIEQLMPPVFMPRNEEEIMRHIVTLSQQLKYIRDLPQVVISFDEQSDTELCFTIVLARVLTPESLSLHDLFERAQTDLTFTIDRVKRVGLIRNKYPKEATVFRVRLPNNPFLRGDYSVDLYKARQEVMHQLQQVIGEVRDFNGGMIAKQLEIFLSLKETLGEIGRQYEFLLENFFHSLFPIESRSVIDPLFLKELFLMLLSLTQEERKKRTTLVKKSEQGLFILVPLQDPANKQKIFESIEQLQLSSSQVVGMHLKLPEMLYLGYIYFNEEEEKRSLFLKSITQNFYI
jgi:hypothetical protein